LKRRKEKMMKKKQKDENENCFSWISECPVAGCTFQNPEGMVRYLGR
jgi:hypothetical protein